MTQPLEALLARDTVSREPSPATCGATPQERATPRERPILFSAPMVRALLDGRKTQTRRIVKNAPVEPEAGAVMVHGELCFGVRGHPGTPRETFHFTHGEEGDRPSIRCPHGAPGDLLWARETCAAIERPDGLDGVLYPADGAFRPIGNTPDAAIKWLKLHTYGGKARIESGASVPSIHMPRWASRITLRITDVRVQRLNDISADDADAEGFGGDFPDRVMPDVFPHREDGWGHLSIPECYARLWDHINGPGAWVENPWVWAVTFELVSGDQTTPQTDRENSREAIND